MNSVLTTSYQIFTVYFQTPRQLPTSIGIRIGFSVAPTATKSLFISMVGGVQPSQLYASGLYIAAFANNNLTAQGDNWGIAITNSETTQSFVLGLNRLYNLASLGIYLPSSLSPTISDSLVTH